MIYAMYLLTIPEYNTCPDHPRMQCPVTIKKKSNAPADHFRTQQPLPTIVDYPRMQCHLQRQ